MLKFAVFDDDGPAKNWSLGHAYLVGKDDLGVGGDVSFEPGLIVCRKPGGESVALGLQFDTGPTGVLTLQTCLLPERDRPYLLDLELARHRIMLLLNKIEEYGLSDLGGDHPVMAGLDRARELFTGALVEGAENGGGVSTGQYSAGQAALARQALAEAIDASERLALLSAERQLSARKRPEKSESEAAGAAGTALGVTVHNDLFSEALQRSIPGVFDFVNSAMRWSEIEKDEGKFSFVATDRWIEWAVRTARLPVTAGPLVELTPRGAPAWLHVWEHDYDALKQFAYEHVKRVVTRYRRAVARWTVVSGINLGDGFSLGLEQMLDLTRLCVLLVRKLQPAAKVVVEIAQPWGEHTTPNPRSVPPLLFAQLVLDAGIAVDAFGLRIQCGEAAPGRTARDLMAFSSLLDAFEQFQKPLHVTALGAPSEMLRTSGAGEGGAGSFPGFWRKPWSPEVQAEWMVRAAAIALSKPSVRSVCTQCLWDSSDGTEMPAGGIVSTDGVPKPAVAKLKELQGVIRGRKPAQALLAPVFCQEPAAVR